MTDRTQPEYLVTQYYLVTTLALAMSWTSLRTFVDPMQSCMYLTQGVLLCFIHLSHKKFFSGCVLCVCVRYLCAWVCVLCVGRGTFGHVPATPSVRARHRPCHRWAPRDGPRQCPTPACGSLGAWHSLLGWRHWMDGTSPCRPSQSSLRWNGEFVQ